MVNVNNKELEKQKALKVSIREGSAASISTSLGDNFIIPFAEAIKANAMHIGLLSAFSGLLGPISQFFGNRLTERYSRKKIVRKFVFLHALVWLPIALIAILYWNNTLSFSLPWILIGLYTLVAIFTGLSHSPWFSWMGDLVPEKEKGNYFSKRNTILGIIGIIFSIVGSIVVNKFELIGYTMIGFSLLFVFASIFKLISFSILKNQYEPEFRLSKKSEFSLLAFIRRYDNYGKFAVYQMFFNIAIMIASPFFGFYMLTELGLRNNLVLFTIISMSTVVFSIVFMKLAGKFSDKYGNLKLLYIANAFFVLTPLLWLFSKNPIYLIIVPGLCSGIANAALTISFTNYTYDAVSKQRRGICISYTNILVGIGTFIGSLIGGFMLKFLTSYSISSFFIVFISASIARLLVALIFLPKIKEVRKVERLNVHIPHLPLKTISHEAHGFGNLVSHFGKIGSKR